MRSPQATSRMPTTRLDFERRGKETTEENLRIGDVVKVLLRTTRNGPVSKCGIVTEIDAKKPRR